jgi:hypothetical protein
MTTPIMHPTQKETADGITAALQLLISTCPRRDTWVWAINEALKGHGYAVAEAAHLGSLNYIASDVVTSLNQVKSQLTAMEQRLLSRPVSMVIFPPGNT